MSIPGISQASAPPTVAKAVESGSDDSAMAEAQEAGHRVEDVSQRTETNQVFANPNGTWTLETASGPVRVEDEGGDWHNIDLTLVERDGKIEPRYSAADVAFSDGGDRTMATMSEKGRDLAWKLPSDDAVLPAPELEGNTATYKNVTPGQDLVVTALATGFSHSLILNERPDFEDGDPVVIEMPVAPDGTYVSENASGGIQVSEPSGDTVVSATQPLMWDSSTDPGGQPDNVTPVDVAVTQPGQLTPAGAVAGWAPIVSLTPDHEFLADPSTQYPVTVDPTYSTFQNTGDTWAQSTSPYTASQYSSGELRAGTSDGSSTKARSWIKFNTDILNGAVISSASLSLMNWWAQACTGSAVRVSRVTSQWWANTGPNGEAALSWANPPTVTYAEATDVSTAKGFSGSCPSGWVGWDVKAIVEKWADGTASNFGFRINAVDETLTSGWRRWRSVNYGSNEPVLTVTYNKRPVTPSAMTISPMVGSNVDSVTPTISTPVSDPDGGNVKAVVAVFEDGEQIWTDESVPVASPGTAVVQIPGGYMDIGGDYEVRVGASDGVLSSTGDLRREFTVLPEHPESEEPGKAEIFDSAELDEDEDGPDPELLADLEATADIASDVSATQTAGAWIDSQTDEIVVGVTNPAIQDDVADALDAVELPAVDYEQVATSKAELDEIVETVYAEPELGDISAARHDYDSNQVVLTSSAPVTEDLQEAVFAAYGDAAVIDSEPMKFESLSRDKDTSPFWAGGAIGFYGQSAHRCTVAWSWVTPSGAPRMLTAGHCYPQGYQTDVATNYVAKHKYWMGRAISSTYQLGVGTVGSDGDLALISTLTNPSLETLNRSGAPRMYTGGTTSLTSTTVTGVDRWTARGTRICFSGRMTGNQCGHEIDGDGNGGFVVEDKDASYRDDRSGEWISHVAYAEKGWGKCARPGDSGAPVYINTPGPGVAAHGVLNGGGLREDDYFVGHYAIGDKCAMYFTEIGQAYEHWPGHVEVM